MKKTVKKKNIFFLLIIFTFQGHVLAHAPGGGSGGGAFGGSGAGRSFSGVSIYSMNDSVKMAFDVYANFSNSLSKGLHQGEQLGPGGKISTMYNAFLFREYTNVTPFPYRNNFGLQQNDFGYTPVWQSNTLSSRIHYRFLPNLWGTITTDCNLDGLTANVRDASSYIQVGALQVKWAPRFLKNFSFTIGKLHIGGSYSSLFDQMPLENFNFNGLTLDYANNIEDKIFLSGMIALGQQFLGRSVSITDTTGKYMYMFGNIGRERNRNHLFFRGQMGYKRIFGIKLIGGLQMVPDDTSHVGYSGLTRPVVDTLILPKGRGWHIGTELVVNTKKTNYYGIVAYGRDDVLLGWLAPDYINRPKKGGIIDWFLPEEYMPEFSVDGSAILYGMYWSNITYKNLTLDYGVSGVWGNPAKDRVSYSFDNGYWYITQNGEVKWQDQIDTLTLQAKNYKMLKGAVKTNYRIAKTLNLGLRYDEIRFFNPGAHSNIPELGWQRPDLLGADSTGSTIKYIYDKQAQWEREAVNTRIVTPFVSLEVGKTFRINAAYAFAFYDKPVYRQSKIADWHGNFTLGATLTYRFAKLPD